MTLRNFWMYPPEVCWYPRILEHTRCFMMIPSENYFSENSDPQRLFYPSETVMVSAKTKFNYFHQIPKVTSSKMPHFILWTCCHVVHFPLNSFIMYIQKILETVLMYVQDILTATRTFSWYRLYVDILREFGWYPHTIRWYFSSNPVNHMVDWYSWQKSAKILFHTEKGN